MPKAPELPRNLCLNGEWAISVTDISLQLSSTIATAITKSKREYRGNQNHTEVQFQLDARA
jgi:hypothetical protein